jgi:hypothetical protein
MLVKNAKARIPELGKVKIGMKEEEERVSRSGNKWRAPKKLPHMIITTLERDARDDFKLDRELMKKIAPAGTPESTAVKGVPALTEIPIALFSDRIEDVIDQKFCWYPGKSKGAVCDGETLTVFVDKQNNPLRTPVKKPCNGEHEGEGWKLHTRFDFAIAAGDARWGGVYSFRTTSEITAERLIGSLTRIKELTFGVLQGLPLTLVVSPVQVSPEGKPSTVYVLHVELRGQDVQKSALATLQTRTQFAAQIEAAKTEARKLLRAPGLDDTPEETADVVEEFHPEVLDGKVTTLPVAPDAEKLVDPPARTVPAESAGAAPQPEPSRTTEPETLKGRTLRGIAAASDKDALDSAAHAMEAAKAALGDDYAEVKAAYYARREAVLGKPAPETRETTPPPRRRAPPPPRRAPAEVPTTATTVPEAPASAPAASPSPSLPF